MKLSRTTGYALTALAYLARQPAGHLITVEDIAADTGVPRPMLAKCLKALALARILHSLRGPRGGFRLTRTAEDITLLEVVEAVDGPLGGEAPEILENHADTEGSKMQRQLQAVCDDASRVQREVLAAVRVAGLVERPKPRKR